MIPSLLWKLDVLVVALALLAVACSSVALSNGSATPALASPTPAPSQTSLPTSTPLPPSPSATITPLIGKATQTLNVRSGPGTDYEVLGMIQPDTVLVLTGKNETATWLQVEYAAGAGGRGWVTAAYVQTLHGDTASLPVLNASGAPVTAGASAPTSVPVSPPQFGGTPTPTLGPASADKDSSAAPAIQVTFSPAGTPPNYGGTRQFSYTSEVSSPQGDAEDWVMFTPYASLAGSPAEVLFSLVCDGNGKLEVELWQNGAPLAEWGGLACGDQDIPLDLAAGMPYQLRLRAATGAGLQYVHYTLTVRNGP